MPSPYLVAKHFPSRTSRVNLTVPLSPAEHRALKTACEVLGYSMAALARYALAEILAPYYGAEAAAPSAFGLPLPPPPQAPRPNGLRYDPREYRRLWHSERLRKQADNAATAGREPSHPPRDTEASVPTHLRAGQKFRE